MTQDQSRAEFEAWARGESPSINLTREGNGYRYSLAEMLYGAWQAARAAAPALPQGCRVVPAEPTEEMFIEGMEASCVGRPSVDDDHYVRSIWGAMLSAAPQPPAAPAPALAGWIPVSERLPESGMPVLLDIGKKYPIRAMWAARFTLEAGDDDPSWGEYNEDGDMYYCPEGWYEWNEHEDTHWRVSVEPLRWAELPQPPKEQGNAS